MNLESLPKRLREKIRLEPCPKSALEGPCWIWTAQLCSKYGHVWWKGKTRISHRVIFLLSGEIIPEGFTLDHLCENKSCQNPKHLIPATSRENTLRCSYAPATINLSKREWTYENMQDLSKASRFEIQRKKEKCSVEKYFLYSFYRFS